MKCPSCKEVLLTMSERQGIEIDYCPQCRGVWLDRGELDKIIEKSLAQTASEQAPPQVQQQVQQQVQPQIQQQPIYSQPYPSHNDYYKHKRRKSFLEEIFD